MSAAGQDNSLVSAIGSAFGEDAWRIRLLEQGTVGATTFLACIRRDAAVLIAEKGGHVLVAAPSAALAQTVRSLAAEFGPYGVRFNAVGVSAGLQTEDCLPVIAFLLSEEASYVTGTLIDLGATLPAR